MVGHGSKISMSTTSDRIDEEIPGGQNPRPDFFIYGHFLVDHRFVASFDSLAGTMCACPRP